MMSRQPIRSGPMLDQKGIKKHIGPMGQENVLADGAKMKLTDYVGKLS